MENLSDNTMSEFNFFQTFFYQNNGYLNANQLIKSVLKQHFV